MLCVNKWFEVNTKKSSKHKKFKSLISNHNQVHKIRKNIKTLHAME